MLVWKVKAARLHSQWERRGRREEEEEKGGGGRRRRRPRRKRKRKKKEEKEEDDSRVIIYAFPQSPKELEVMTVSATCQCFVVMACYGPSLKYSLEKTPSLAGGCCCGKFWNLGDTGPSWLRAFTRGSS